MSVQSPSARDTSPARYDERGAGWILFAGVMLLMVGILNFIGGIAAIDNAKFYVNDTQYIISDLKTWGWVVLIIGALQILAAFGDFGPDTIATWFGVAVAASTRSRSCSCFLPIRCGRSRCSRSTSDIYGLVAYGGRQGRAA